MSSMSNSSDGVTVEQREQKTHLPAFFPNSWERNTGSELDREEEEEE